MTFRPRWRQKSCYIRKCKVLLRTYVVLSDARQRSIDFLSTFPGTHHETDTVIGYVMNGSLPYSALEFVNTVAPYATATVTRRKRWSRFRHGVRYRHRDHRRHYGCTLGASMSKPCPNWGWKNQDATDKEIEEWKKRRRTRWKS